MRYAPIQIEHADNLTRFERLRVSNDLSGVVATNRQYLEETSPDVLKEYGSYWQAMRHLGALRKTKPDTEQDVFIIRNRAEPGKCYEPNSVPGRLNGAIGMAYANRLPEPGPLQRQVELAFWHAQSTRDVVNWAVGNAVVQQLKILGTTPGAASLDDVFMLASPDDEVRNQVLADQGFIPVDQLQDYDLGSAVLDTRVVWVPWT